MWVSLSRLEQCVNCFLMALLKGGCPSHTCTDDNYRLADRVIMLLIKWGKCANLFCASSTCLVTFVFFLPRAFGRTLMMVGCTRSFEAFSSNYNYLALFFVISLLNFLSAPLGKDKHSWSGDGGERRGGKKRKRRLTLREVIIYDQHGYHSSRGKRRFCQRQSRLDKQEVLNVFPVCLIQCAEAVKVSPSVCRSADSRIIEQACWLSICKHTSF